MVGIIFGLEHLEKRKERYSLVTDDVVENADVCIIGSGAAGAILAEKLSATGKSVVLVEKGGYYDSEDMNQREFDMMPLLWKNGGANFTDNLRIVIAQGECLGGSTIINDAVCFKTPFSVRKQWRDMGVDISEEMWHEAINEIWNSIHVTKVQESELNQNNLLLKQACLQKGYKSNENDRNCRDCMGCGFCHLGCHYETKQDALVTHIRTALRRHDSNLRIYCNCNAEKITYTKDENGVGRINGVDANFIDNKTSTAKFKLRVNAKVLIVSAGAIASSQLLIKNAIAEGKAGKGLSLHPSPFLIGKFENEINAFNGIPMGFTCHEFGVTNEVSDGGFLIESIFLPIFQFSLGLPFFLEQHVDFMRDFSHYAMAGVLIKDGCNGSITLSDSGKPRVKYVLSQKDIKTISRGLSILAEMWFDVGAQYVLSGHQDMVRLDSRDDIPRLAEAIETNPDGLLISSAHPQGGNRMGQDASVCVVDSRGKLYGFKNLYVCDSSIFPTSVGVNPQITVMALATIVANHINAVWKDEYASSTLEVTSGETCSITQPMYCSAKRLERMFDQARTVFPVDTIINASTFSSEKETWSFNKVNLTIYNNDYWKGFLPHDQDFSLLRYFAGFYKRFQKGEDGIRGVTHPFELPNVFAENIVEERQFPHIGNVIYLRYKDPPYSLFYDFLKIIDRDNIIGRAYFGRPPDGIHLLTFCMSRRYSVNFMTELDHQLIYEKHSRAPTADEIIGRWTGQLVSDSAVTPVVQVFTYTYDVIGKLQMNYVFGDLLRGISRVTLTPQQMNMYDWTNWHDEVRIVREDFMVGKWCSPWVDAELEHLPSFLSVDRSKEGKNRLCLRFTLKRSSRQAVHKMRF